MIDVTQLQQEVAFALAEDIGEGDITAALISPKTMGQARLITREPMVVCGVPWVEAVMAAVDTRIQINWHVQEGDVLPDSCILAEFFGPLCSILTAERVALNFLQTLSAVASKTHQYVTLLEGTKTQLLDTRKTLPGLRMAQKYAVRVGGGVNHRIGLYDAVLIKENHIQACGSISQAVARAKANGQGQWIEVEVESLAELQEALTAKPDRILLDNFSLEMLAQAVKLRQNAEVILEASGGVSLDTLRDIALTGVDYISVGDITKSVRAIDLSLRVMEAV